MASQPIDLVIFDCDGVLVDSEPISIAVLLNMIASLGGSMTEATAYAAFLGRSMASVVDLLASDYGLEVGEPHLDRMRNDLHTRFREELRAVPGVREAVRALPCRVCVASSSQPERIRLSLELTGLLDLFEPNVFSATMVRHGKPAPDLFLYAAAEMGVDPARCLVVEDSPAGVAAAKAAGMRVVGFVGASHGASAGLAPTLAALQPELVLDSMATLSTAVATLVAGLSLHSSATERDRLVCAVDVGTRSARAGIFDKKGRMLGRSEHPILLNHPMPGHAEHDSDDIWAAVCSAVRGAIRVADVSPEAIVGISFDATCSLVVRDQSGAQMTVSPTAEPRWDTMVWLDHRAIREADECTACGHAVLDYVGGVMSPEMQVPKLMWLKRHMPDSWAKAGYFFDLADFLTWRASGSNARSQTTLTCKWTYLAHDGGWRRDFFEAVGVGDLLERGGLPDKASPAGTDFGALTEASAGDLGLTPHCRVGAGLIDAYAGALGVLGGFALDRSGIDRHLALIAGTSSCVMAMSPERRPFAGVWGPYHGVAFPDIWLSEGGQSATGALLDHVIRLHGAGGEPEAALHARIVARIGEMLAVEGHDLAGRLHVLPDFHGNRSPNADPHALGVISGLTLDASFDSLCRLYWRTMVAIALGVRHILDALNERGYVIDTLHVTGGHTRNNLLMELYADATGCAVVEPAAGTDAVLLGTAMVAATAAGLHPDVSTACAMMSHEGTKREPNPVRREGFDRDYRVFLEMHRQRQALDLIV